MSGAQVRQGFPELVPGTMDVRFYCAQGQVEGGGYFLVGPALDVPQENAGAIFGAQLGNGVFDGASELARLDFLERRFVVRPHVDRGCLGFGRGLRVGRAFDADRVELALAEMIDGEVVRDLEQPARELEFRTVAIDVVQDANERILREIFRGLAIADHAENEREDGSFVAVNELPERRFPSFFGEGCDIGVGECREIVGRRQLDRVRDGQPADARAS